MSTPYSPLSYTASHDQPQPIYQLPPIATQLPEIFSRNGSAPTTPETLSGGSPFTLKRKSPASFDLVERRASQRSDGSAQGYSQHGLARERPRRMVSWHESLLSQMPQRRERHSLPGPGASRFEGDFHLPAIKPWKEPPRASHRVCPPTDLQRHEYQLRPIQLQPPSPPPKQAFTTQLGNPPTSEPVPVRHLPQSPHPLENPIQSVKPWPRHLSNAHSHDDRVRNSPQKDADLAAVYKDSNPHSSFGSPTSSELFSKHPSNDRHDYKQAYIRKDPCGTAQSSCTMSPKVDTAVRRRDQRASGLSPVQEDDGRSRVSHQTNQRSIPISSHAPQAVQCNWDATEAVAETTNRRRRGNLPKESTAVLNAWFREHIAYPYPKEDEKHRLQVETGLSLSQIGNWFINARRRRKPYTTE